MVSLSDIGRHFVRLPQLLRQLSPAIVMFAAMAFAVVPHGAPQATPFQIAESENRHSRNGDMAAKRLPAGGMDGVWSTLPQLFEELADDPPVDAISHWADQIEAKTPASGQKVLIAVASQTPAHRDRARGPPRG